MPKSGKKGVRKNCEIESDVKLSDFANSSARTGRLRKSIGSSLSKEVETLWFERELDEFQFLDIACETEKKLRSKVTPPEESLKGPGIRYPIDVWFIIGQYIKPDDVKLFATICKDSYRVSRSYSFWIKIYKKFYKPNDHLPTRLQPECIEQAFSLKTSVIRSLYLMYPQFVNQLSANMSDPDCLLNLCCTSTWRNQQNGKWWFNFKFRTPTCPSDTPITYRGSLKDLWTSHDAGGKNQDVYVNHNPDEGCKILRFSNSHFVAVSPMVMGSRLSDARINLASDMRHQKLQLMFCQSNYLQSHKSSNLYKENGSYNYIVEFDAVENLTILNWWHPQYPIDNKV